MTKLATRKSKLRFTTGAEVRYRGRLRPVIVEVENEFHATIRLAGTRQKYPFSFRGLHDYAANLFARAEQQRRKAEREERRKARVA